MRRGPSHSWPRLRNETGHSMSVLGVFGAIVVASVALGSVVGWRVMKPSDPVYQRRRLS